MKPAIDGALLTDPHMSQAPGGAGMVDDTTCAQHAFETCDAAPYMFASLTHAQVKDILLVIV